MTVYSYRARDEQGDLVTGTMEKENEELLLQDLDQLGYSVIEVGSAQKTEVSFSSLVERMKPVTKKNVILFTRQLATLLHGGTALVPSLLAISEQTESKKFKIILEDVSQSVQKGESFSQALSRHPDIFPELFISMVQVGEAGGLLDQVLDRLATLGTQEMEMQARMISALVYPLVLVSVAFLVISFLVIGVLPKFVVVFDTSEVALPLPTKIVLGLSWIARKLWFPLLIATGLGLTWFKKRLKNEEIREKFHAKLLKIPIFGNLYSKIQISRFARISAMLIGSGIPILHALDVVGKTITNLCIRRAIKNIRDAIAEGNSLVEPFKASGLFSPMVVQMISTGEKSGNLDKMLNEIAVFYDPEIEYTIKNLTSLLEPFMLLVMGGMVAFIALSVLLPIFNMIKVFRG